MKKFLTIVFISVTAARSMAQNASSPYSIIGLGDIEKSYFDRTSGLGHAGVALHSDRNLLISNPASYSFLESRPYQNPFYFDLAARFKSVSYSGIAVNNNSGLLSNDLQFKKISFAIKPKPKWGLCFGLLPFSSSSYSFTGIKRIQGDNFSVDANYEGNGSTNLIYAANSYAISKNLSVGVQTSFLFGHFTDRETMYNAIADSGLATTRNIYLTGGVFKGGLLYRNQINKNLNVSVGATGSLKSNLNADYEVTVVDGNTILKETKEKRNSYTSIPAMGTVGIAAVLKNIYTFTFDYTAQNWGSLKYAGTNYALVNSNRISAGFQYSKFGNFRDKNTNYTYEKSFFQTGFYYNKSYLKVYGDPINEWGVTFGAGTQLTRSGLGVLATIDFGSRGTTNKNLIKENFTQFGLTFSYRDFWLSKKVKKYN